MLQRLLVFLIVVSVACASCGRDASTGGQSSAQPSSKTEGVAPAAGQKPEPQQAQAEAALQADLADVYLKHGRFEDAERCFTGAIQATRGVSEDAMHHVGLASAQRSLGKVKEAVENLEKAADVYKKILPSAGDEQKEFVLKQICLIYRELGKRKEAIEWAEKLSGEGKEPVEVLKLARLYALLGENELAIDTYKAAWKRYAGDPGLLAVQLEYADFLFRIQSYPDARKLAEEVASNAADKQLVLGAKRLLLRLYDATGVLDKVDLSVPPVPEEKKEEKK